MYTPTHASTLWCPMARVLARHEDDTDGQITDISNNRIALYNKDASEVSELHDHSMCLGPKCALWTWIYPDIPRKEGEPEKVGQCGLINLKP